MTKRKKIPIRVLQLLYAHSGNQCAFPECGSPIFEDNGLLTGECCHIKANSIGGPRYDANQLEEERNGVENLILLCRRHHTIVDRDVDTYTVDVLQQYKKTHEEQYMAENLKLSDEDVKYLQRSGMAFWYHIQQIDTDNIVPDLKMKVDTNKSLEDLIYDLDAEIKKICEVIDQIVDADHELQQAIPDVLSKYEIDLDSFNKILTAMGLSDLHKYNWEMYNLAVPNCKSSLKMLFLQLAVKILEEISSHNKKEHELLPEYRNRFTEHQKGIYYID